MFWGCFFFALISEIDLEEAMLTLQYVGWLASWLAHIDSYITLKGSSENGAPSNFSSSNHELSYFKLKVISMRNVSSADDVANTTIAMVVNDRIVRGIYVASAAHPSKLVEQD